MLYNNNNFVLFCACVSVRILFVVHIRVSEEHYMYVVHIRFSEVHYMCVIKHVLSDFLLIMPCLAFLMLTGKYALTFEISNRFSYGKFEEINVAKILLSLRILSL